MISDPHDLLESELYVGTNHIYPTEDGTHDIRKQ